MACWHPCACFLRVLSCLLNAGTALQAFGAGNLPAMSLILQRALILSCALSGIVWAAWTQLYLILPMLGESMPSHGTSSPPCMHRMSGTDRAMCASHFSTGATCNALSLQFVSHHFHAISIRASVKSMLCHSALILYLSRDESLLNTMRFHVILPYQYAERLLNTGFTKSMGKAHPGQVGS